MMAYAQHLRNLAALDRLIRGGQSAAPTMAGAIGVTVRTVMRYLEFLREELAAPINFDRKHNVWRYTCRWHLSVALGRWMANKEYMP